MAESTPTPSPKRWLLISGAPVQQALWRPLTERYHLCMIYDGIADYAQSMGVQADSLNRYITPDAQERALCEAARVSARCVPAMDTIQQRLLAGLNGNTPPEFAQANDWFPGYVLSHAQKAALLLSALDQFALEHDLAGCVVHEDVAPDMRWLVAWCRRRGLPTIHLPHAPCHLRPKAEAGPDIHRETRAEWIGASGPYVAEFYRENGHDPDKIAVVGAPQWDGLYAYGAHPPRDEARRVLCAPENGLAIWYGATWYQTTALRGGYEHEIDRGFRAVLDLARRTGAYVMITLHPNDGAPAEEYYADMLQQSGLIGFVTRHHVNYIAAAADVLIAQGPSNLCIDAAIQGLPSCYIQTEGFDYRHPLPYRGGPDDVSAAVNLAINSRGAPVWQDFVASYNAAHPDGGACARIVDWIGERCP